MLLACAFPALQSSPPPQIVRYAMPNGEGRASEGAYNYWDDAYVARKGPGDRATFVASAKGDVRKDGSPLSGGAGKLVDGVIGRTDWRVNLGHGNAHEWVGWHTADPTLVLDYGAPVRIESLSFFSNNFKNGRVELWDRVEMSFGDDGKRFGEELSHTNSEADHDDLRARWVDVAVGRKARFVRLTFQRHNEAWIFLSEIVTNVAHPPLPSLKDQP